MPLAICHLFLFDFHRFIFYFRVHLFDHWFNILSMLCPFYSSLTFLTLSMPLSISILFLFSLHHRRLFFHSLHHHLLHFRLFLHFAHLSTMDSFLCPFLPTYFSSLHAISHPLPLYSIPLYKLNFFIPLAILFASTSHLPLNLLFPPPAPLPGLR